MLTRQSGTLGQEQSHKAQTRHSSGLDWFQQEQDILEKIRSDILCYFYHKINEFEI